MTVVVSLPLSIDRVTFLSIPYISFSEEENGS